MCACFTFGVIFDIHFNVDKPPGEFTLNRRVTLSRIRRCKVPSGRGRPLVMTLILTKYLFPGTNLGGGSPLPSP